MEIRASKLKFRNGLRDGLPIALGYLSVSFGFGISAVAKGLETLPALLISMTNLTSAGQVAGLSVIAASGAIIEMIMTQLIINLRYSLMGLSLTQKLDDTFSTLHRMAVAFFITDEIYAVSSSKTGGVNTRYMYGLGLLPYLGWAAGTLLGAVAGSLLPADISSALGIAIYGMFVAIIVPPAKRDCGILFAVVLAAAVSCLIKYVKWFSFITQGFAIIICALLAAAVAALIFPVKEDCENDG
ncbi:MAG: AzlC family ABC transporter permease [Ruminococcaceae bacterium]|nr:AzlC family ABC transporter permease [Oscillospiraceae bacterium]